MKAGLVRVVGETVTNEAARALLAQASPFVPFLEAAMGLGLLHSRSRRLAMVSVVAMHAAILLTLGPVGRSWNTVVWPWNVTMIALVLLLFAGARSIGVSEILAVAARRSRPHTAVVVLFWVLPAASLFGLWDSYLSAALYSENVTMPPLRFPTVRPRACPSRFARTSMRIRCCGCRTGR